MNSTEQPASGGFGLMDAAQQLEGILASEAGENEEVQTQEAKSEEPPPKSDEEEGEVAAEASEETEGDEPDPDVEATDDAEAEEASSPEDIKLTVKIDGKEQQISAKEAAEGYMRTADYTRKTQEASEIKKTALSELQAAQQERAVLAQLIPIVQAELQSMQAQEPDWQKLYNEDPLEFVRQKDAARDRQDRINAYKAEQQRLEYQEKIEQDQKLQQQLSEGRAKLLEKNPQWKDPKRWNADVQKMTATAVSEGFSEDELQYITDPRTIGILRKAAAYDELMAKKPTPVQSKSPKVASAGSSSSAPKPSTEINRAKQRLAKTGRIADAAALFENFVN